MNYFDDEQEWKWLFENGLDWDKLIKLYNPEFPTPDGMNSPQEVKDFLKEILTATGEWTGTSVSERAEELDKVGAGTVEDGNTYLSAPLQATYDEAKELAMIGLCQDPEFGGMNAPQTIGMFLLAQLSRACLSTSTQLAFFSSIADMVHRFCDHETAERIIPQIIAGDLSGSMCLTEPGCGSDLGAIQTKAKPVGEKGEGKKYLLNGSKMFITNGGGGLGFVLAKCDGLPDNLDGLGLFFVEQKLEGKEGLNFRVEKNEEKMGLHGSFTTLVVYENTEGVLVGKEGEGFKLMLHLMNEARIAVGFQALGVMEASLAYARKYAEERIQFGKPIAQLPLLARNMEDYEVERDAIRALLVDTASHYDIFQKLDMKKRKTGDLTAEEKSMYDDAVLWTRKRTPLVKYYACEAATNLSQRGIQILGGYGFIKEYPQERYHRDSFGPLLYEGTSQIQALMALKDVVKYAIKDPSKFFTNIIDKHPASEFLGKGNEWSRQYKSAHYRFKKKMMGLLIGCLNPGASKLLDFKAWADPENVNDLMIHAETLTQALSYMETLRVLCDHANKDESRSELFHKYLKVIQPRLEAIYTDWAIRN
ncbi:MAG: hypothetical protein EP326_02840 [Deltaproteobacteria bacterium]|nr:MAG: hypothetical protein EP326_02840 [Deltaproteobacteria bacterium]TNF28947.1 MAG: hypothetical protein EP319_07965 [Deltaproteobacteria bacterium]